jgi:hypothetical protein
MNSFYVYEHWRPDKDICFYVGEGTQAPRLGQKPKSSPQTHHF